MAAVTQPRAVVDFAPLLDVLPMAAYMCDADGYITYYNRRAVEAWGREPKLNDPADRYCGSFRMTAVDGAPVRHDECWMARCLHERKRFEGEEIVVVRPDGTRLVVLAHAIPIDDEDGKLVGAVNLVVDITDRKRTEQRLQERERELADVARRKDAFLATLAHELRNPLAPIRNSLHVLRLAASQGGTVEHVRDTLERQVNHMVRLVDDLMDVSRITRDNIELRLSRVELAAIVHDAVETARPLIDAARHQLTVTLPAEPLILVADHTRLTQVLANLLNNAAKYTPGGGHIAVTARRDGQHAVLTVRDDGEGIPAAMLPRVFDLFTQLNRSYSRAHGGLGIGLTLVKRLVEMHHGLVSASSAGEGRGAEFEVRLPLAATATHVPLSAPPPVPVTGTRRILVIDDNHDAAESLGMLLKFMGADAHVVNDGAAALAALTTYQPSAVLLDIGMPGMDGYEFARRARELPAGRDITLIALTGWGQEEDRHRSKEAGIDHHLIKPVDYEALSGLLAAL